MAFIRAMGVADGVLLATQALDGCCAGIRVLAAQPDEIGRFHRELRQRLAQRRIKAFATFPESLPSAVGEDG